MIYPVDSAIQLLNNWGQMMNSQPQIEQMILPGFNESFSHLLQAEKYQILTWKLWTILIIDFVNENGV